MDLSSSLQPSTQQQQSTSAQLSTSTPPTGQPPALQPHGNCYAIWQGLDESWEDDVRWGRSKLPEEVVANWNVEIMGCNCRETWGLLCVMMDTMENGSFTDDTLEIGLQAHYIEW